MRVSTSGDCARTATALHAARTITHSRVRSKMEDIGFWIGLESRVVLISHNSTRMTRMIRIFTDHFVVRDRMNQSSKGETTQLKAIRSLTTKSVKIRVIRVPLQVEAAT